MCKNLQPLMWHDESTQLPVGSGTHVVFNQFTPEQIPAGCGPQVAPLLDQAHPMFAVQEKSSGQHRQLRCLLICVLRSAGCGTNWSNFAIHGTHFCRQTLPHRYFRRLSGLPPGGMPLERKKACWTRSSRIRTALWLELRLCMLKKRPFWAVLFTTLRIVGAGSGDSDALDFTVLPGYEQSCAQAFVSLACQKPRMACLCDGDPAAEFANSAISLRLASKNCTGASTPRHTPNFVIDLPRNMAAISEHA